MDPNTTLEDILGCAADILDTEEEDDTVIELAEKVVALHEWLSRGGFLPKKWERK
jgi:hypothetical protein